MDPKKPKVPNLGVLAVMTPNLTAKSFLLESDPEGKKIFTEPHYNGFCAVLVRLDLIEPDELEDLIYEAWKRQAPKKLIAEFEG